MRASRPARVHPCLPVPRHERQRLATAAHLALQAMLADQPQDDWIDLPAAVASKLVKNAIKHPAPDAAASRR